ncbi:hypothetical protein ACP70R_004798 [Stipagrostis hirtigluma subsp. patula]
MASANDGDRATAGILRLLLGMGAGAAPASSPLPQGGGALLVVQHLIVDADGDLFSGGVGGGVPPASKAAIAALKEVKAGGGGQEGGSLGDCAICLDGVEDAAKEMPCGHRFHGECLERWLGVHGNCPVCRHELPPAKEEEAAGAAGPGGEERRRPRAAMVVSYLVLGDGRGERQQQQEREEPWNIRIEDVD